MLKFFKNDTDKYRSVWVSKSNGISTQLTSAQTIEITRLDIVPALNNVVTQLIPLAQSKFVTLDLRLLTNELYAEVHEDCFILMVYNLIGHSIKDAPLNGCVSVDAHIEGLDFVLTVMHNGTAFTKEEIFFAFNLQENDDGNQKETFQTGIGLDSVKQIVDAHRGQLQAESRDGFGTAYTVRLPMIGDVYL